MMPAGEGIGIVLATYGTLERRALATYNSIKARYEREFPGCEIRLAFTSDLMRRKLAEKESISFLSPPAALAELHDYSINDAVVQSLQIVPGSEFHKLLSLIRGLNFAGDKLAFRSIDMGLPLLAGLEDCRKVSKTVEHIVRKAAIKTPGRIVPSESREVVVLVGHGSGHPGDSLYSLLERVLESERKNIFVATLEGYPGIDELLLQLERCGASRVTLVPLLLVAGGHVLKDLAGDGPDTWKSRMQKQDLEVEVQLRGLGDCDEIVSLFLDHTRKAVEKLRRP